MQRYDKMLRSARFYTLKMLQSVKIGVSRQEYTTNRTIYKSVLITLTEIYAHIMHIFTSFMHIMQDRCILCKIMRAIAHIR